MYYTNRYGPTSGLRTGLAFGAAETEKTIEVGSFIGNLHEMDIEIPNFTNAVTAKIEILRPSGVVCYSREGLAKSDTTVILLDRVITAKESFKITLSGAPGGAGGTIYLTPYFA